ncbi:AGE family epimerase/isomerase [Larsenimonas rhizosphaerae]|uniref:AGE family epimerase/isomerase n=1 Tax=Larsenimonas rhizosphaerae TaxID=2944682 RepID=UPI0020339D15|nr:AGE family epimerase/isomerase [Larsenimonas rhizosphaerae]MCM2131801.1 AGE family epimerase/isomerase [Larsenimonas rhizosphaerae]
MSAQSFTGTFTTYWLDQPEHHLWLREQTHQLIAFGKAARLPDGGFGWLDEQGRLDNACRPQTLVTARMTHVYALAALQGIPGAAELVDHGLKALTTLFHDDEAGGWFSEVQEPGASDTKEAYLHAFVGLAAASATQAGRPGAHELLNDACHIIDTHFWSDDEGAMRENSDRFWTEGEAYRGANSNMHSVEAFLAIADALNAPAWRYRALSIAERLIHDNARHAGYHVIEHFDDAWQPLRDYNQDKPGDPFRPYGVTPGHGLEWSRLLINLEAALLKNEGTAPDWLARDAAALFDAALAGWSADGAPGMVYTLDWAQQPVAHERMHWVMAEGVCTAAALLARTGHAVYEHWYRTFWDYIDLHLIDRHHGSWHHELDRYNQPSTTVWSGKPDIYHALQATLFPRLPQAPTAAQWLKRHPETLR